MIPRPSREPAAALAILSTTVALVAVVFWPGHMNADTLSQLAQARSGGITDWHSPVLQWLWHLVWPLGVGPGWALVAAAAAFVAGAYLLLRVVLRPLAAAIAATLVALSPQVLGYLGTVSRDTWLAALLLLTFGLLAAAAERAGAPRTRLALAALAAGWLALATRQNAAFALVVAFAVATALLAPALPVVGARAGAWSRGRRALAAAGGGIVVCVAFLGSQLALQAAVGVRDARPEQSLYIYDLARLSDRTGQVLLPPEAYPAQDLELLRALTDTATIGPLIYGRGAVRWPASDAVVDELESSWGDAITDHPLEYAGARLELLAAELGISEPVHWVYHPVIDPNTQGFALANPDLDRVAVDYLGMFNAETASGENNGTLLHAVWLYLLVCAVAAATLLPAGPRPALRVAGALGLSIVAFQVGVLALVMTAQYRFEYATVAAGCVLAPALAALLARRHAPRLAAALGVRDDATPAEVEAPAPVPV